MISGVEIPNILNANSIRFVEIFRNTKKVTTSVIFTSKSFKTSNFVILVLWTSRD